MGTGDVTAAVQGDQDMISIPLDKKRNNCQLYYKSEISIKQAPSTWHMTSYEMSFGVYNNFAALAMNCEE